MTPFTDPELLDISVIQQLQEKCYLNAKEKGFWREQDQVLSLLKTLPNGDREALTKAVNDAFHAMKGDLMHSELGERTEAQRKTLPSDKLPSTYSGEEEELADTIIRILDYAGRRRMKLGEAIVLKMRYNAGRPFMHGKGF